MDGERAQELTFGERVQSLLHQLDALQNRASECVDGEDNRVRELARLWHEACDRRNSLSREDREAREALESQMKSYDEKNRQLRGPVSSVEADIRTFLKNVRDQLDYIPIERPGFGDNRDEIFRLPLWGFDTNPFPEISTTRLDLAKLKFRLQAFLTESRNEHDQRILRFEDLARHLRWGADEKAHQIRVSRTVWFNYRRGDFTRIKPDTKSSIDRRIDEIVANTKSD